MGLICPTWRCASSRIFLLALISFLSAPATFFAQSSALNSQEIAILQKLQFSAGQRRSFVHLDPLLTKVARARAADMARRHYYSHVNPDGYGPNYLVEGAGYPLPEIWGAAPAANNIESVAAGRSSPDETWIAWMNSPHHKEHLLGENSAFARETSVGVAYLEDPQSDYQSYWVVLTAPPPVATIAFTSPRAEFVTSIKEVAIAGVTNGPVTVGFVRYRVEHGPEIGGFLPTAGTTAWAAAVQEMAPGPNVIRAQSLDSSGAVLAEAARGFHYFVPSTLDISVEGGGTVTPGFLGQTQQPLGERLTVRALPQPGFVFAGWSGDLAGAEETLSFTMAEGLHLQASFIPDPFLGRRGTYSGLLLGDPAGLLTLTVSATGRVTGRVSVAGNSYVVKSLFAVDGTLSTQIPRPGLTPWELSVRLDLSGDGGITGSIATESGISEIAASPRGLGASAGLSPYAGRYTVSLPPDPTSDMKLSQGNGLGLLLVQRFGQVTFSGLLADGQPFAFAGNLSEHQSIAVYSPLYRKKGFLQGEMTMRDSATGDLEGTFRWSMPGSRAGLLETGPVDAKLLLVGTRYTQPRTGTPVLQVPQGTNNSQLLIGSNESSTPLVQLTTLGGTARLETSAGALPGLAARLDPRTGLFTGTFKNPSTMQRAVFKGVILQKQNAGFGYFLSAGENGYAKLEAAR